MEGGRGLIALALFAVSSVSVTVLQTRPRGRAGLTFTPFSNEFKDDVLVVDCTHPTAKQLTHHLKLKGQRGLHLDLQRLRADTTTEQVLLAVQQADQPLSKFKHVSTNHFDLDSFFSVWSSINPEHALRHKEVLRIAGTIGDFRELKLTDENNEPDENAFKALALCCWVNSEERRLFYKPFEGSISSAMGEGEEGDSKFHYFLPIFGSILDDPMQAVEQWKEEYDLVISEYTALHSSVSSATIQRIPSISLSIICQEEPGHYYSLFSATIGLDIVLAMYNCNRYEVEVKYTTFIDLFSRNSLPRVDLETLAKYLNQIEKTQGVSWFANRTNDSGPLLRLDSMERHLTKAERYGHPFERPIHSSSIAPQDFTKILISYLNHAYQQQSSDAPIAAKKDWKWSEFQMFNREIDWMTWEKG